MFRKIQNKKLIVKEGKTTFSIKEDIKYLSVILDKKLLHQIYTYISEENKSTIQ